MYMFILWIVREWNTTSWNHTPQFEQEMCIYFCETKGLKDYVMIIMSTNTEHWLHSDTQLQTKSFWKFPSASETQLSLIQLEMAYFAHGSWIFKLVQGAWAGVNMVGPIKPIGWKQQYCLTFFHLLELNFLLCVWSRLIAWRNKIRGMIPS